METLQRTANRGSVSTGLYEVANSVKFDDGNNTTTVEFFERNVSSAGSRTTGTFSAWIKRTDIALSQYLFTFGNVDNDNGRTFARFQTDGTLRVGGGTTTWLNTTRVFRDTSAWYHIVVAIDTTSGTADNRIRVYVNGVEETSFGTRNNPSQNDVMGTNFGKQAIGYNTIDNNAGFNGYMCEVVIQDGVASAPTEFGEFDSATGIWIPKDASGATMGTNGTYLKFENAASMGAATAGNAFTVQNINQNDQATDTCTNNFCTFNPLMYQNNPPTISQGAMESTGGGGTWNNTWGSIGVKSGKWYYEFKVTNTSSSGYFGASTTPAEGSDTSGNTLMYNTSFMLGNPSRIDYYYWQNGSQVSNESTGWGTISTNDIIGIALDLDSSTKKFIVYKNGSALNGSGTDLPTNMQDEFIFPLYVQYENRADEANFGGYTISSISSAASDGNGHGTFEIAPPSGYLAICTKNIAETG
jgi:hypothetical protein